MNQTILKIIDQTKNRKVLISFGVSVFAIQSLISIVIVSVNFPISDDWPAVFAGLYYQENNPNWLDAILAGGGEHFLYFYRLIMMAGFLLNSFNVQQFMVLNWGFLCISIGIFYFLLKKIDTQLTWLIIPLSAFVFSPKMVSTGLTASIGLIWIGTFFFLVSVVGILNKQKLTKIWFILVVSLSVTATFTSALGPLTWIIGTLCLIHRYKENKNYLLIWIIISIIALSLYATNIGDQEGRNEIEEIISFSGISWGLEYVSNPFSVKFVEIRILIGIGSIISLIFVSTFLLKKQIKSSYPWIIFGSIGILSTILTDIGRFGIRLPTENYFIIMSTFTQISLLVLVSILFLKIWNSNNSKKNKIKIIYMLFIIIQMSLLGSAYLVGSQYVSEWGKEKKEWLSCFDLPTNIDVCDKWNVFGDPLQNRNTTESKLSIYNQMIENKMGIFSDKKYLLEQERSKLGLELKWQELVEYTGNGDIETVNGQDVSNIDSININDSYVNIIGWMNSDKKIKEVYLILNDKVFLSSSDFKLQSDIIKKENYEYNIKWNILFLSGFLEKGCYDMMIGGINDSDKFILEKEIELCRI